jgi:hypothetical protein
MSAPLRPNVLLGTLLLLPTAESGRESPLWSGFHCQLRFPSGLEDAMVVVEGRESIWPGGAAEAKIYLAHPDEIDEQWLVPETVLEVLDAGKPLGKLRVFEPVNDLSPGALSL